MLSLYNSLTRKKEAFKPRQAGRIAMFVCGPTVYDLVHLGNARTYVVFDFIAKWLRYTGYKLNYLQNITDIDDKIIIRARQEKANPKKLAQKFEKAYLKQMKILGVTSVSKYIRASEAIPDIITQIERLIKLDFAYAVSSIAASGPEAVHSFKNQDVYFDIEKFKDYGKLSKQKIADLESGKRIEVEKNKRNPRDFVIWKAQNYAYEPTWASPWGQGRPGWHIEDTAITEKRLGQQYDIHGGGLDLIFPHHEAEIALQESASNKKPFVRYWLHSGLLTIQGQKMSKSLNNFIILKDLLEKYSVPTIRFFFLATHYRSPADYKEASLDQAEAGVNRLSEFIQRLNNLRKKSTGGYDPVGLVAETRQNFEKAMNDDFNTPLALAVVFDLIKEANRLMDTDQLNKKSAKLILAFIDQVDKILGIVNLAKTKVPAEVTALVEKREKLRQEKRYSEADDLRIQVLKIGYRIEDTDYGPLVKKLR